MKYFTLLPVLVVFFFLSSCSLDIHDAKSVDVSSSSTVLTPQQGESFPSQKNDTDNKHQEETFSESSTSSGSHRRTGSLEKGETEDIYDIPFDHRNNNSDDIDNIYASQEKDNTDSNSDSQDDTSNDSLANNTGATSYANVYNGNKCLIGIHGRADGSMQEPDYATIQSAKKIEAVKLLTNADPSNIDRLLQINHNMFIIYRIYMSIGNRNISPSQFVNDTLFDIQRAYNKGIRYFEVHNEPNLYIEGLNYSWKNGTEFGTWLVSVLSLLHQQFPLGKFGYPGLSPGSNIQDIRLDEDTFFNDSITAVNASDWLAIHTYFIDSTDMQIQITRVKNYLQKFSNKPIMITEFSNPIDTVSKTDKGNQYVEYYKSLRNLSGLKAAFSFVISASSYFGHETWREENGGQTPIPSILANSTIP